MIVFMWLLAPLAFAAGPIAFWGGLWLLAKLCGMKEESSE